MSSHFSSLNLLAGKKKSALLALLALAVFPAGMPDAEARAKRDQEPPADFGMQIFTQPGCDGAFEQQDGSSYENRRGSQIIQTFGSPEPLLERWNGRPAHAFVEIVADESGNVVDVKLLKADDAGSRYDKALLAYFGSMKIWPEMQGRHCMDVSFAAPGQYNAERRNPKRTPGQPTVVTELPYPEAAYNAGIGGVVELSIWVTMVGTVHNVSVLSEEPGGHDFGIAAQEAVMEEWRFENTPPGRYRLRVRFAR